MRGCFISCACYQLEVSATGRSLVQSSTECGVLSVIWKPQQCGGLGPLGLSSHGNIYIYISRTEVTNNVDNTVLLY